MRKRIRNYILAAVVGTVLGFRGQFGVDFFCWNALGNRAEPKTFSQFFLGGRQNIRDWTLDKYIRSYDPRLQNQARSVAVEAMLVGWFMQREEQVGRAILIGAFLAVSAVLAREHFRQNRSGKKSTDVKASSKNSPHDNAPAALPDGKPIAALSRDSEGITINVSKKEVVEHQFMGVIRLPEIDWECETKKKVGSQPCSSRTSLQ